MEAADLCDKAVIIWPWLIPYLDDWGRGSGLPRVIKATCFPSLPVSESDVSDAVSAFVKVGLLVEYADSRGRPLIAANEDAWWAYQTHVHSAKRDDDSKSKFPAPSGIPREHAESRASPSPSLHHATTASPVENPALRLANEFTGKTAPRDVLEAERVITAHPWVADLDDVELGELIRRARAGGTRFLSGLVGVAGELRPKRPLPEWCGGCEEGSRLVSGVLGWSKCPHCHPGSR